MKKLLIILLLLARCDDAHKFKWRDEDIKYCHGHTDVSRYTPTIIVKIQNKRA